MGTGNIVIVILCIVAFIFPFVLIGGKGRKKKRALKKALRNYAGEQSFNIDELEVDEEFALGIDSNNHVALFARVLNEGYTTSHINLNEIKTCKLNHQRRDVNSSNGPESLLSKLELGFYPKTKTGEVVSFVLFDENSGTRLGDELQMGNKWAKIYSSNR